MLEQKDVIENKNQAINKLSDFLENCIIRDEEHLKKANLLSYWIKNYIDYIEREENFNSFNLKHYKRGDVIKANLGFNIGNELGGLHYCVVLDVINAKSYSTLTIIPLSSSKPNKKIHNTSVSLGNELAISIINKARNLLNSIDKDKVISYEKKFNIYEMNLREREKNRIYGNQEQSLNYENIPHNITDEEILATKNFNKKLPIIEKIIQEAEQMKSGSIALVNQITTISKQRIYDPKNDLDILSGIRISEKNLNLIDEKIKELFLKKV